MKACQLAKLFPQIGNRNLEIGNDRGPSECQIKKQKSMARDAGFCGAARKECRECVAPWRGVRVRSSI